MLFMEIDVDFMHFQQYVNFMQWLVWNGLIYCSLKVENWNVRHKFGAYTV